MNHGQRNRLLRLEQARQADGRSPDRDQDEERQRQARQRSARIRDRRLLQMFSREIQATEIVIEPPPTSEEVRRADEFLEEIRHSAQRNLFEKDRSERTFDEWLAERRMNAGGKTG